MKKKLRFFALSAVLMVPWAANAQQSLPVSMDFEDETAFSQWTMVNCVSTSGRSTSASHDGSYGFSFHWTYSPNQFLVSPEMVLTTTPVDVSFWYRNPASSYTESFAVGYSSTTGDTSAFTWLETVTVPANTPWTEYSVLVPAGVKYVAIKSLAYDAYYLYVDDIYIGNPPTCLRLQSLSIDAVSSSSITLSWIDTLNSGASYTIYDMSDTSVVASGVTDTFYTVDNLIASTSYTFGIRANCTSTDSSQMSLVSGRTACTAVATTDLPWTDGFESYPANSYSGAANSFQADCWTVLNRYSANYPYVTNSSTYVYDSLQALALYSDGTNPTIVVLPAFESDLEDLYFSFYARTNTSGYGVEVGVMSNPVDATTFQPLTTCVPSATNIYQFFDVTFSGNTTGQIALRFLGSSYGTIYLDNFTVQEVPSCVRPSVLTISDITTTSATLGISDPNSVNSYVVVCGSDSSAVYSDSYSFSNLQSGQSYDVRVYTLCDSDSLIGPTAIRFMTLLESTTLPYSTGFETDDDTLWSMFNGTNAWIIDTIVRNTGASALYISNNDSANVYSNSGINISYAVRAFEFDQVGSYAYSFDWRANGEENWDFLRAWIAPSSAVFVSNAMPDGSSYSNSWKDLNPAGWIDLGGKLNQATTWQNQNGDFRIDSIGTYYMVFMWANDGSSGSQPPAAIDNVAIATLTCARPYDLTLDSASNDGLMFHWSGDASSYNVLIGEDSYSTTDTFYTVSGLDANTVYTVSVLSVCGSDNSMPLVVNFRTACGAISTLPWTEDFETGESSAAPTCWTVVNGNPRTNTSSSNAHQGTKYLHFSGGQPNFIILPEFADNISTMEMSFWTRPESFTNSSCGTFSVGYVTSDSDSSSFVAVETYAYSDFSAYDQKFVTFAGAPDSARIAFRHNSNSTAWYWYVDDVDIHAVPNCTRPIIALSDITSTSATVNLSDANNMNSYVLIANGDTLELSSSSYSLTSLSPVTTYTISAATICGAGDTTGFATVTFTTPCGAIDSLPWIEDFESYTTSYSQTNISCWEYISNGSGYNNVSSVSGTGNNSSRCYRFMPGNTRPLIAILPPFDTTISSLELTLLVRAESATSSGQLVIGYLTDPMDSTSFVPTATISGNGHTTWTFEDATFAGAPAGARIAIADYTVLTNYYWWIDSLNVHLAPSCTRPSVTVSAITENGATVHVTDANNVGHYLLVLNGDTTVVNDTVYTYTTLTSSTSYTLEAATICAGGDTTAFVSTTFFSLCGAITTLPWTEDFDAMSTTYSATTIPCWDHLGGGYVNITSSYSVSGNALRFYPNSSSAPNIVMLPPFAADLDTLEISFQTRPEGSSSGSISVGYITDATDSTTFVALATYAVADFPTSTSYMEIEQSFVGAPSGARIALRHNVNATNWYWFIDEIDVHVLPACARATVAVDDITENSASVTLSDANNTNNYCLVLSNGGTVLDSTAITTTTHAYTNLSPSSSYTLRVYTICSDGSMTRPTVVNFNTLCGAILLPWSEDFEGITTIAGLNCWERDSARYGINTPLPYSGGWTYYTSNMGTTGNHHVKLNIYGTNCKYWLVTPQLSITSSAELSFDYALTAYASSSAAGTNVADDRFYVLASTDDSTWIPIARWGDTLPDFDYLYSAIPATSTNVTLSLSQFAGQTIRIAFYGESTVSGSDNDLHIDNISVSDPNAAGYYNVMVSSADATMGSASATQTGRVEEGTSITATAVANEGFQFLNWTSDGTVVSTANPYTFTVSENIALVANFEVELVCEVPTAVNVSNVTLTGASIDWTAAEDQENWDIHITGTNYDQTFNTSTKPYAIDGLTHGVTYTVTVRANCSATNQSDWSTPITFTTQACQPVTGVAVTDVTANTATVSWTAPAGASRFEVNYGMTGFDQGTGSFLTVENASRATLTGLSANTPYDVYVRTLCGDGIYSAWSAVEQFETTNVGIDDVTNAAISLYPNPASSTVTLKDIEGVATVTVVDMNGRVNSEWTVENGELTIDVTEMAQGAYFVRIVGEQVNVIRKLIVR